MSHQPAFYKVQNANRLKAKLAKFELNTPELNSLRDRGILIHLATSHFKTYAVDLSYFINKDSKEINITKIIPVARGLADLAEKNLNKEISFGFFNLYDAVELIGIEKYRDKAFTIQILKRFKELFAKHFYGYCKVTNKDCRLLFRSLKSGGFPKSQLYKGRGFHKPSIYLNPTDNTYYIHDNLYKDLLAYGFSEKQLKEVIGVQMVAKRGSLPDFLIRRHFRIPDIAIELEREMEKEDSASYLNF